MAETARRWEVMQPIALPCWINNSFKYIVTGSISDRYDTSSPHCRRRREVPRRRRKAAAALHGRSPRHAGATWQSIVGAESSSFVHFLIDRYGRDPVARVYSKGRGQWRQRMRSH